MQDPIAAAFQAAAKPEPAAEQLKCPRCDSTNTKFCYYNNYNLLQPRHFCKNCRRYWTKGGALRNIPSHFGNLNFLDGFDLHLPLRPRLRPQQPPPRPRVEIMGEIGLKIEIKRCLLSWIKGEIGLKIYYYDQTIEAKQQGGGGRGTKERETKLEEERDERRRETWVAIYVEICV